MKPRLIFLFLFFACLVSGLATYDKGPVAISPGSDFGTAAVGEPCPTFSWTAVEWASGYRIEVFEAASGEIPSYDQIAAAAYPVLSKEIQGRALSWTPTSDEKLINGNLYIWYVQAMDSYGTAKWSEGKSFMVQVEDRLTRIIDKVTDTLKANGVSDDVINQVLSEMIPETEGRIITPEESQNSGYKTQDKLGIQGNEVGNNTWYGEDAGLSLTSGTSNSFFGYWSGVGVEDGSGNTYIGQQTGQSNTSGDHNSFLGLGSGYQSEGNSNVYIGYLAGADTSGNYNTFIGNIAGYSATLGDRNTFIGGSAGYSNTVDNNTFIGYSSGYTNSTGIQNTFVGYRSGELNEIGINDTFVGYQAGMNNTASHNTFLGRSTGEKNTTGESNTFLGHSAGYQNTTGNAGTYVGRAAGFNNDANNNTFIGHYTGYNNTSGEGNVFLGHDAGYNEAGSNKLYIDNSNTSAPLIYGDFSSNRVGINGRLGVGTQSPGYNLEVETSGENAIFLLDRTDGAKAGFAAYSDKALLGTVTNHPLMFAVDYKVKMRLNSDNSLVMTNGAQCTAGGVWQDASSRAYKENIQDLTLDEAKDTLSELNPVKYNYKKEKEDEHLGFIAEDVPDLVASKDRKGMSPMDVVAVLTKVVQEQQNAIIELKNRVTLLEKKSK